MRRSQWRTVALRRLVLPSGSKMRLVLSGIYLLSYGQLVTGLQFVTRPSATVVKLTICRQLHYVSAMAAASTLFSDRSPPVNSWSRHVSSARCYSRYSIDRQLTLAAMVELSYHRLRSVLRQYQCKISTDATSLICSGGVFWNGPAALVKEEASGERMAQSVAGLALPLLNRFFNQASQLFQVGVLMGPIPTVFAACVTAFWAWQVRCGCSCVSIQVQ